MFGRRKGETPPAPGKQKEKPKKPQAQQSGPTDINVAPMDPKQRPRERKTGGKQPELVRILQLEHISFRKRMRKSEVKTMYEKKGVEASALHTLTGKYQTSAQKQINELIGKIRQIGKPGSSTAAIAEMVTKAIDHEYGPHAKVRKTDPSYQGADKQPDPHYNRSFFEFWTWAQSNYLIPDHAMLSTNDASDRQLQILDNLGEEFDSVARWAHNLNVEAERTKWRQEKGMPPRKKIKFPNEPRFKKLPDITFVRNGLIGYLSVPTLSVINLQAAAQRPYAKYEPVSEFKKKEIEAAKQRAAKKATKKERKGQLPELSERKVNSEVNVSALKPLAEQAEGRLSKMKALLQEFEKDPRAKLVQNLTRVQAITKKLRNNIKSFEKVIAAANVYLVDPKDTRGPLDKLAPGLTNVPKPSAPNLTQSKRVELDQRFSNTRVHWHALQTIINEFLHGFPEAEYKALNLADIDLDAMDEKKMYSILGAALGYIAKKEEERKAKKKAEAEQRKAEQAKKKVEKAAKQAAESEKKRIENAKKQPPLDKAEKGAIVKRLTDALPQLEKKLSQMAPTAKVPIKQETPAQKEYREKRQSLGGSIASIKALLSRQADPTRDNSFRKAGRKYTAERIQEFLTFRNSP